jgi:hypothetical protein
MFRFNANPRILATVAAIVTFAAWTLNTIITSELDRLTVEISQFQRFVSELENKRSLDYSISTINLALGSLVVDKTFGGDDANALLRASLKEVEQISFNAEFAAQVGNHSSKLRKISSEVKLEPAVQEMIREIDTDVQRNFMKIDRAQKSAERELSLIDDPKASASEIRQIARKHLSQIDENYFNITMRQISLLGLSAEVSRAIEVKRKKYQGYLGYAHASYIFLIVVASLLSIVLKYRSD